MTATTGVLVDSELELDCAGVTSDDSVSIALVNGGTTVAEVLGESELELEDSTGATLV